MHRGVMLLELTTGVFATAGAFCCFNLLPLRTVMAAKMMKRLEHLPYKKEPGRMKAWSGSYPCLSTLVVGKEDRQILLSVSQ